MHSRSSVMTGFARTCAICSLRQNQGSISSKSEYVLHLFLSEIRVDRRTDLDRKALVKQYGASLSFRQLRRRLTVGCPRMNSADGIDRCQARYPCLDADADVP
jgi:hypothetical protein